MFLNDLSAISVHSRKGGSYTSVELLLLICDLLLDFCYLLNVRSGIK